MKDLKVKGLNSTLYAVVDILITEDLPGSPQKTVLNDEDVWYKLALTSTYVNLLTQLGDGDIEEENSVDHHWRDCGDYRGGKCRLVCPYPTAFTVFQLKS